MNQQVGTRSWAVNRAEATKPRPSGRAWADHARLVFASAQTAHDLGGGQTDQKHVSIDRLLHVDHIPPLPLRKKIMHKARRKSR